jgi:hypothetical protein
MPPKAMAMMSAKASFDVSSDLILPAAQSLRASQGPSPGVPAGYPVCGGSMGCTVAILSQELERTITICGDFWKQIAKAEAQPAITNEF